MKIEFRLIVAAVIAAVLISAGIAEGARSCPLDEDAVLALPNARLSMIAFTTSGFPGIASRTAPKRDYEDLF